MSNPQNKPPQNNTLQGVQRNQKFGFLKTVKLVFLWGLVPGFISGGLGGGYVVYNADKWNIPLISKGTYNSQDVAINKGTQIDANNPGNIGPNSGNQAGSENSGTVGNDNTNASTTGNSGIGDITTGDNAKIEIKITPQDPSFQNSNLPGYFPEKGFSSKPPQLSEFEAAKIFTEDLVLSGSKFSGFLNKEILINNRIFPTVFYLEGSSDEVRKTAFKLNGRQKAVLLQFGLADLTSGDVSISYEVNILADGRKVWTGQTIYGTQQQQLSVPLQLSGATTLVIEYKVSKAVNRDLYRYLYFTRAELLY